MQLTDLGSETVQFSRIYIDNYEQDVTPESRTERLYLGGDAYTAPAVFVKEGIGNWNIYYICRDYLGSITHITNADGTVVQELDYDAWGRLRNPVTQEAYAPGTEPVLFLGRGYTGHEHLQWYGLINMNARLYDPALGRFLSPDPYVQMPGFTQNFNRYSYALNNPLCYIDQDGELVIESIIIGAAIFGYLGGVALNGNKFNPLKWDWKSGKTWAGIGIGAVAGGLAGWGFAVVAPWAASSTAMYAQFGMSYTATAFSLTGTVFGGAAGFATGYAGGYLHSKNNDFALKNGVFFSGIGAAVGSAIGLIYGLSSDGKKYLKDKPQIYTSPVRDNPGNQNGECVLRCLEEFSKSYGQSQYDFNYWYSQNGNRLGVHANDVKPLINNTNIFSSDKLTIDPFSGDFSNIATAMSQGKRVMMGFKSPNGEHAVMVDKLILWGNNKYRIFFSETSPVRIAPRSTSNLMKSIGVGAAFWTFFF